MGIYVITGGTTGIGAATRDHLHRQGHRTVNLDLKAGDHQVDLSTLSSTPLYCARWPRHIPRSMAS